MTDPLSRVLSKNVVYVTRIQENISNNVSLVLLVILLSITTSFFVRHVEENSPLKIWI